MVERLSTSQIFSILSGHVISNQKRILDVSEKLNTGKKFVNTYEDPVSMIRSQEIKSKISSNNQSLRLRENTKSELELAEVSVSSMKDIMDRVRELAITGGNDTLDSDARIGMAQEIRTLGESIVQLANTKSGGKFIFSGTQSTEPTISLSPNDPFANAIYKNNVDDGNQRSINGNPSSVALFNALITDAQTAKTTNKQINPNISANGSLDFEVNDGNGTVTNFTVALTAGDNLAAIIAKVNAAFTGAGGAGTVAQELPTGYLNFDTALVTGNAANKDAKIQVLPSSSNSIITDLNLKEITTRGKDRGILKVLNDLEASFAADNPAGVRAELDNIESNIDELIRARSKIGSIVNQVDTLQENEDNFSVKLSQDLSIVQDVDFLEASLELSNAQAALATSTQTTSNFFNQSIFNFLGS